MFLVLILIIENMRPGASSAISSSDSRGRSGMIPKSYPSHEERVGELRRMAVLAAFSHSPLGTLLVFRCKWRLLTAVELFDVTDPFGGRS